MDPRVTKKRRLAPKVSEKPMHEQLQNQQRFEYPNQLVGEAQPPQSQAEPTDFERLARSIQEAASHAYAQTNRPFYTSVSVFLLRWEDDLTVEKDLLNLQALFRERYNYRTEAWSIPSCPNPNVKLLKHLAQHVDYTRPDHLLIIYYIGHSYIGADENVYWACNSQEDSPKLKWNGLKNLIEDAQADVLMLLDCCSVPDAPPSGSNGIKQGIAAYGREAPGQEAGPHTFTYSLIDALKNLSAGPPFAVQRLYDEILSVRHHQSLDHNGITNGTKPPSFFEGMPITFSLTPNSPQTITIAPLPSVRPLGSPVDSPDGDMHSRVGHGDQMFAGASYPTQIFEELRALVSIQLHGDRHEIASFKQWLSSTFADAVRVTVEGMFQGPQTVMLLSMPIVIYTSIVHSQDNKAWTFLGYVKSHNMLRESQKLADVSTINSHASSLADGKILLEAAEAAASSPAIIRHEPQIIPPPNMIYQLAQQAAHALPPPPNVLPDQPVVSDRKDDVEDSDEMHEAAIQLKALSHVRPVSHDSQGQERSASHVPPEDSPRFRSPREESPSSQDGGDQSMDDQMYSSEYNSPASRPKARRSIQKQGPKQDTRCTMCSHTPFKDSSSLRKHIAAAHTRPFPCAFSFAGCTSTFGSKNEWKRHIASQHLCLTYYRCSSCPQSTVEGKGNEFNRKDLFTQHLRRMHAPFAIKKAIAKGDSKLQVEWETHVKEMQATCLVIRRSPPQRSACPKADCSNVFEGAGSWDDWTEHVGRHMEKGEAGRLGVDRLLAKWALDEGIIERREDGEYRLCGTEREAGGDRGYYSDSNTKKEEVEKIDDALLLAEDSLR